MKNFVNYYAEIKFVWIELKCNMICDWHNNELCCDDVMMFCYKGIWLHNKLDMKTMEWQMEWNWNGRWECQLWIVCLKR